MADTESRIAVLEEFKRATEVNLKTLQEDVKEIKEKLLGRPTWFVTVLITFLTTLCVALIIQLAK